MAPVLEPESAAESVSESETAPAETVLVLAETARAGMVPVLAEMAPAETARVLAGMDHDQAGTVRVLAGMDHALAGTAPVLAEILHDPALDLAALAAAGGPRDRRRPARARVDARG